MCKATLERNHMNVRSVGKPSLSLQPFLNMQEIIQERSSVNVRHIKKPTGVHHILIFTSKASDNRPYENEDGKKERKESVFYYERKEYDLIYTPYGNLEWTETPLGLWKSLH